jgi:response regulator RpfG family c-di-GMP phosphodiesterase
MSDKNIRMLSIDDKSLTTNLDRAGYRKMGVQVSSVATYKEARDVLREKKIDVVVINMDFEDIDAPAIIGHLKNDEKSKEIVVVATSVRSSAAVRNRAIGAGADLFVEQPLPRHYFIEKIKNTLEQQVRTTERISVHGEVELIADRAKFSAPIGDLSSSGMLISTEESLDDGTQVELTFVLPGYKKELAVAGEVVRTIRYNPNSPTRMTGLGVRFVEFKGDSQKRLESYIEKSSDKEARMLYYL